MTVGHDENGDPIVKWASGRTKKELQSKKDEIDRTYITGNTDARRDVSFSAYTIEWYKAFKEPRIGIGSQKNYVSLLNVHLLPVLGDRQMRAIRPVDLQAILNSKSYLSASTVDKIYMTIKQIFSEATAQYIIDRDPSLRLVKPSAERGSRRALTEAETAAALYVGNTHPEGLLLLILYYTGVRIGEALGLQWRDIDFEARQVSIRRDVDFKAGQLGQVKTKASLRNIPVPAVLLSELNRIRGVGEAFILPAPETGGFMGSSTFKRRWHRLARALHDYDPTIESNADGLSILTPHYFRHNYASVLYNADVDVLSAQRWLGHSDIATTLAIYSHLSEGKRDKNADKLDFVFGNKAKVAEKLPDTLK